GLQDVVVQGQDGVGQGQSGQHVQGERVRDRFLTGTQNHGRSSPKGDSSGCYRKTNLFTAVASSPPLARHFSVQQLGPYGQSSRQDVDGQFAHTVLGAAEELAVEVDNQRPLRTQPQVPAAPLAHPVIVGRRAGQGQARQEPQHFPARQLPGVNEVKPAV